MSVTIHGEPRFQHPCLLVAWGSDAGQLGTNIANCLSEQIGVREFGEIEPLGFFPVGGVAVDNDIIRFPTTKFFSCENRDLVLFFSMQPHSKLYTFLDLVLDVAQRVKVREIYIVGGLTSRIAHSERRRIRAVVNQPEFKERLSRLGLETWLNYRGPPSINSFLLWIARNRGIPGTTLWGEIPFYLSALVDWRASRTMLDVLDRNFGLHLDFKGLDQEVESQEARIDRLRQESSEVDSYISKLERGEGLTQDEAEKLVRDVADRV